MNTKGINIIYDPIRIGDYTVRSVSTGGNQQNRSSSPVRGFNSNKTWIFTSDDVQNFSNEDTEIVDIVWSTANFTFLNAFKAWIQQLGTTSIIVTDGSTISNLDAEKINVFRYFYPENDKYFGNILNVSSSLYQNTYQYQPLDPKILWYYLDHNYYRDYRTDKNPADETNFDTNNYLSPTGSIILFPRKMTGEIIKKQSLRLKNINPVDDVYEYVVVDDGIGNIIDTTIDETKIIDHKHNILYVGFNEKYRESNFVNTKLDYVLDWSNNLNEVKVVNKRNISYTEGIPTTDTQEKSGVCANFSGSYLEVTDNELFNFSNNLDFAFSFWINIPPTQSIETFDHNPIFDKKTVKPIDVYSSTTGIYSIDSNMESKQYPFDIVLTNRTNTEPYKIQFRQSDSVLSSTVSSNELSTNEWHHVVCQKTGSIYEVWVDGQLNNSTEINITSNIQNKNKFYIAGNGTTQNNFSGSLDEIRVFNKGLNENEIENLGDNSLRYGYAYQRKEIGNVYYETGIVVVSDPRPKYKNAFLGRNGIFDYQNFEFGFEGGFKSINTIYEHEIVCTIEKYKFNFTQNPSSLTKYTNRVNTKPYVTNSQFTPYITTIGLYNDNHDLVAVAKLATPLKKRKDIDVNIIIRFDM
jgi:hypothetical protein